MNILFKLTEVCFFMSVNNIFFSLRTDQIRRVRVERWSRLRWWFPTRNARSWIWMPLHISLWRPKTRNGLKCSLWPTWELNLYLLISGKLLKKITITSYYIHSFKKTSWIRRFFSQKNRPQTPLPPLSFN